MLAESADTAANTQQPFSRRLHLECNGQRLPATAVLQGAQTYDAPPSDDGRLRILRPTSLRSVPAALFQPTHFIMQIHTTTHDARRLVNGLVHRLLPPADHTGITGSLAYLAHIDFASPPANPFAAAPAKPCAWLSDGRAYVLLYASRAHCFDGAARWQLVAHVLATPRQLEPLRHFARAAREPSVELRFLAHLASRRGERMRMQRTLSTENIMRAGESGGARRASNLGALPRRPHRGRMTLSDIELMMRQQTLAAGSLPDPPQPSDQSAAVQPDPAIEQKNKQVAKKLIVSSLKERGIGRNHQDFAALWSQIYRSLRFSLRDKLALREFAPRELKAESDKHATFYCSNSI